MIFPKLAPFIMICQSGCFLCCKRLGESGDCHACNKCDDENTNENRYENGSELGSVHMRHQIFLSPNSNYTAERAGASLPAGSHFHEASDCQLVIRPWAHLKCFPSLLVGFYG